MTVIITGASGWLGSAAIERFAEKRKVIAVDIRKVGIHLNNLLKSNDLRKNITFIQGDILYPETWIKGIKATTLINCAGMQHPRYTSLIYRVNRDAPAKLLKACNLENIKNFIHISSSAIHGSSNNTLNETSPFSPLTHYAKSKLDGEKKLSAINSKTKVTIIRPGVFYGEHPSKNLIQLIHAIRTKRMPIFGKQGCLRTYVDIQKVVDAMQLAEKAPAGAYLIGDKTPLTTLQLYQVIASELHVKLRIRNLPLFTSRIAEKIAYTAGLLNIHLRFVNIAGEFGRPHVVSSKKGEQELNYNPHPSSELGIIKMVRSCE